MIRPARLSLTPINARRHRNRFYFVRIAQRVRPWLVGSAPVGIGLPTFGDP
jgi:hypothetical protein